MRLRPDVHIGFGLLLASIAMAACTRQQPSSPREGTGSETPATVAAPTTHEKILRGQYLVRIGSCNDCHTPWIFDKKLGMPRPDMTRMLSGHPEGAPDPEGKLGPHDIALIGPTFTSFKLPFGTMYALNLTPDMDTGIGTWTEEMFLDIFRKGRHLGGGGRGVLPPMPWLWIRNMTDDDLKAVFAYLKSIPPITNAVPSPKIPDEVIWQLRDSFDRYAAEMPQEEWAARKKKE
jgi:hypothetical protein